MQAKWDVQVELHCTRLPGVRFEERIAIRLGIQLGREVVDDIPGDAAAAVFVASVRLSRQPDGEFDFGDPYVFGTREDRFLYLCWGERTVGVDETDSQRQSTTWDGFRRAKVKLGHVPPAVWEGAFSERWPVVGRLEMTDAKGGPECASLRPDEVLWNVGRPR